MKKNEGDIKWSEIDKVRFYGIGTGLYSALAVMLHPINVIKTRQQVLSKEGISRIGSSASSSIVPKLKGYYRGLGIVIGVAIPARTIYITTLESSREFFEKYMTISLTQIYTDPEEARSMMPLVASLSGGFAGGIASMSSQLLVVPMDVISQRQMIMEDALYRKHGSSWDVIRSVVAQSNGLGGLYRGFSLSLLTSLPSGSIWWGTYSGCKQQFQSWTSLRKDEELNSMTQLSRRAFVQIISGISAATMVAVFTQPLDVVKTRLQVNSKGPTMLTASKNNLPSYREITSELYQMYGVRGFYRGTIPRIMNLGLWGIVMSSAYEFLRHICRKDYNLRDLYQRDNQIQMLSSVKD